MTNNEDRTFEDGPFTADPERTAENLRAFYAERLIANRKARKALRTRTLIVPLSKLTEEEK